jgi:hypothetical protein
MSAESHALVRFGEPDTTTADSAVHALGRPNEPGGYESQASAASHDRPDAPGWSSAATAVHSMLKMPTPVLLVLMATSQPPLIVDFGQRAYSWALTLDRFPKTPERVEVQTEALVPGATPVFEHAPRNLDGLLWLIGLNSFAGDLAWWLPATARYKMTRWPNLTELSHSPEQMRMIAILGNAALSPEELARVSHSAPADAQRLLNALSLMGILEASTVAPAATPRALPEAPRQGLFRRVLDRLAHHV